MDTTQQRIHIVEIGKRLYEKGYIVAGDGNVSIRTQNEHILITPTGVNKGLLTPDMIVKTTLKGEQIAGEYKASSEIAMHLAIYEERPDVQAVVHAHPPVGTGFAAAGLPLDQALISEIVLTLGCIPLAKYGTPSTRELPDTLRPLCHKHNAILMANHGAVTYGPNLEIAYGRMETLEHFARISLVAHLLGGGQIIPSKMVDKLIEVREKNGLMEQAMRNQNCSYKNLPIINKTGKQEPENELVTLTRNELIELINNAVQIIFDKYSKI